MKHLITLITVFTILFSISSLKAQDYNKILTLGWVNSELGSNFEYGFKNTNKSALIGISYIEHNLDNSYTLSNNFNLTKVKVTEKVTSFQLGAKLYFKRLKTGRNFYVSPQILLSNQKIAIADITGFILIAQYKDVTTINRKALNGAILAGVLYQLNHFAIDISLGIRYGEYKYKDNFKVISSVKIGFAF